MKKSLLVLAICGLVGCTRMNDPSMLTEQPKKQRVVASLQETNAAKSQFYNCAFMETKGATIAVKGLAATDPNHAVQRILQQVDLGFFNTNIGIKQLIDSGNYSIDCRAQ